MKIELMEGAIKKPEQLARVTQRKRANPLVNDKCLWLSTRSILLADATPSRTLGANRGLFSLLPDPTFNMNPTLATELPRSGDGSSLFIDSGQRQL